MNDARSFDEKRAANLRIERRAQRIHSGHVSQALDMIDELHLPKQEEQSASCHTRLESSGVGAETLANTCEMSIRSSPRHTKRATTKTRDSRTVRKLPANKHTEQKQKHHKTQCPAPQNSHSTNDTYRLRPREMDSCLIDKKSSSIVHGPGKCHDIRRPRTSTTREMDSYRIGRNSSSITLQESSPRSQAHH